jgi:hypothetical protein
LGLEGRVDGAGDVGHLTGSDLVGQLAAATL